MLASASYRSTIKMSERERELGYPTPDLGRRDRPVAFSLPILSSMNLPRPISTSSSLPAKLDRLRVSSEDPPKVQVTDEADESSSLKAKSSLSHSIQLAQTISTDKVRSRALSSPPSSPGSLSTSTEVASSQSQSQSQPRPQSQSISEPSPFSNQSSSEPQSQSHSQTQTSFSTWVPDDSLRFINPNFLSSEEKHTLEKQLGGGGKRKADHNDRAVAEEKHGERPRKIGRSLEADEMHSIPGTRTTTGQIMNPPVGSYHTDLTPVRSNLSSRRSVDLDLLRSVKSNNLSIPPAATAPSPTIPSLQQRQPQVHSRGPWPGQYIRDKVYTGPPPRYRPYHYDHQHQFRHHNEYRPPFTTAPLYHPGLPSYSYPPAPRPNVTDPHMPIHPHASSSRVHPPPRPTLPTRPGGNMYRRSSGLDLPTSASSRQRRYMSPDRRSR